MLEVGGVFAGYTIEQQLGAGGMGEVYLARHPRLPRRDALKILRPELSTDPDFRARFIREADLAATLTHPHIVTVHDRGEHNGQLWIATAYIDGTDAAQLLRERYPAGMPADEATIITTAIAAALDYAHGRGLLHRDVKPANILLSQPDHTGQRQIYLADFGIARPLTDPNGLTATNTTLGTFNYAAPEQLTGDTLDGRADQYALAATTYQLLTGTTPFTSAANPIAVISQHLNTPPPRVSRLRPGLTNLDPILAKALAKNPADRYPTCTAFAQALIPGAQFIDASAPTRSASTPTPSVPSVNSPASSSWLPRPPSAGLVVGSVVVGLAVALAAIFVFQQREHSAPGSGSATTSVGALPVEKSTAGEPTTPPKPQSPSDIARMIVFLDPSGSGGDGSVLSRRVSNGRGGTAVCQEPPVVTPAGYPSHTFAWDTVLRIRQALHSLGVRTAMTRGNDDAIGPCGNERAAMANSLSPNASITIGASDQPGGGGFLIQYSSPPVESAQAKGTLDFAAIMRDALTASDYRPYTEAGSQGFEGTALFPELNLARYPTLRILLGNVRDKDDAGKMETSAGRQGYAEAVVRGIVDFLQTQPPRR